MTFPDLEPCPHCGSKAWLRDSAAGRSRIECDECQIGQLHFADHADAVSAWNCRAARSTVPEAGKAVDRITDLRIALNDIIALDHHWHGPEIRAAEIARAALLRDGDMDKPVEAATACLAGLASNEPCKPDDTLKRCTICGFIIDTQYAAETPDAEFQMRGRNQMHPPAGETIRATQDGSMEGASVTVQSAVDASSPALASVPAPSGAPQAKKVQHRVRPHKQAEWGPWTDGYVPADYLGWFEQREVPTEIGWRDKRIEILTDECVRRSKQISEIAKQRNDAEIRAETAEAEATSLRRKLEELRKALEPFGKWLDALDTEFADHADDVIAAGIHGSTVTFGDLRRARTLSGASE